MTDGPWLVVGLGNPGRAVRGQPAQRRPDGAGRAGAGAPGATFGSRAGCWPRPQAVVAEARLGRAAGRRARPAGGAGEADHVHERVGRPGRRARASTTTCPPERTVLVHDELDIPFADVRLKRGGGEGGHNGLRDTTKALGTQGLRPRPRRRRPARRAAWTRPTSCCATSRRSSSRSCPWLVDAAADAVEARRRHRASRPRSCASTRRCDTPRFHPGEDAG